MNRSFLDGSAWIPPLESDDSGLSDSEDSDGDFRPSQTCKDESSEEDCAAPTSLSVTAGTRAIQWKTVPQRDSAKDFPVWGGALPHADKVRQPIQYFRYFFDSDLLELIVQQSNLFYFQKKQCSLNMDQNELEQFLGTVVYMSVIQLPRSRLYWATECRVPQVSDIMSRERWKEIKQFIHFNDNSNMASNNDKLYKIRPLVNSLLTKCNSLPQDQMLSIHELLVPFKGKTNLKQYVLYKPYKMFALCDTKGLVHSFDIYTGHSDPLPEEPDRGASENVVLKFAQVIPSSANHLLFLDSRVSSLDLLVVLANKGIPALGAMKQSQLPGCRFSKDDVMKKKEQGAFEEKRVVIESVEIRAVKWFVKGQIVASTFASACPVCHVESWDKKLKKNVSVQCPRIISIYNEFKGGVNALEALISNFPIEIRSKKLYHKLLFFFIDLVIVNSWLLYQRDCDSLSVPKKQKQKDFLDFRISIAQALCLQGKDLSMKRSGQPYSEIEREFEKKKRRGPAKAIPAQEVRSDSVGHWPVVDCTRKRCKRPNCNGQTTIQCAKCNVHLCLNKKRNCFRDFHE